MTEKQNSSGGGSGSARRGIWAPLAAALFCTALIVEAILTAAGARAQGDLMVMVAPLLLGAVFISIAAFQAWWTFSADSGAGDATALAIAAASAASPPACAEPAVLSGGNCTNRSDKPA